MPGMPVRRVRAAELPAPLDVLDRVRRALGVDAQRIREDVERRLDLEFIRELRTASYPRLKQIATNLSYGGPHWQIVAVHRALERFGQR